MAIAPKLEEFLRVKGIEYDLVTHPHSQASWETAHAARLRGNYVGKGVVLADEQGYLMALSPLPTTSNSPGSTACCSASSGW